MAKISIDFTGVETSSKMSPGVHRVTINSVEMKKADSGNDMIVVSYKNAAGEVAYDNFVLVPQALWKLKIFLEAVYGQPITGKMDMDPVVLKNRSLIISVDDEEYINANGQSATRARVSTDYKTVGVSEQLGVTPKVVAPTPKVAAPTPVPPTPAPVAPTPQAPAPEVTYEKPADPAPQAQTSAPEAPARQKFPWEQ